MTNILNLIRKVLILIRRVLVLPHKVKYYLIIITSNLSNDRSKASSKTIPPHSAI